MEKTAYFLLGADAIVDLRFTTSMVAQGAADILVYGTEVELCRGA